MRTILASLLLISSPSVTAAGPSALRVAVIYPSDSPNVSTIGNEAACITRGVLEAAKRDGVVLDFKFFDNARDPVKTAEVAAAAIKEGFEIVVGTTNSSEGLAAAKILEGGKIPFVTPTASHPDIVRKGSYAVRVSFDDDRQGELLARFALEEAKAKKIVIIRNDSMPYSASLADTFKKTVGLMTKGVEVGELRVIDGHIDYSALATAAASESPDLIFLPLNQMHVANLYIELAKLNKPFKILGGDAVGGRAAFFKVLAKTSPKIDLTFVKQWDGEPRGKRVEPYKKLHAAYCQAQDMTMISASAYDAATLVVETARKKPKARGLELVRELRAASYDGLTGALLYDERGEPKKPLHLFKIENDKTFYWKRYPNE